MTCGRCLDGRHVRCEDKAGCDCDVCASASGRPVVRPTAKRRASRSPMSWPKARPAPRASRPDTTCEGCGVKITGKRSGTLYCGNACKLRERRRRAGARPRPAARTYVAPLTDDEIRQAVLRLVQGIAERVGVAA